MTEAGTGQTGGAVWAKALTLKTRSVIAASCFLMRVSLLRYRPPERADAAQKPQKSKRDDNSFHKAPYFMVS
jgi:hypothetical protein